MECELCYTPYDPNRVKTYPKVLQQCPHTYCLECLIKMKEKVGKAVCPVCPSHNVTPNNEDPDQLPNNEGLLKAIESNENQQHALAIL